MPKFRDKKSKKVFSPTSQREIEAFRKNTAMYEEIIEEKNPKKESNSQK